jgi:hypothetical protein
MNKRAFLVLPMILASGLVAASAARSDGEISCKMHFTLAGWSVFYKTADGEGTIQCDNGHSLHVHLKARGGGLTVGKTKITDGHATFSGVYDIKDILGHYGTAEAHAGVSKSSVKAQVMTKGTVSMALTGKGEGWNVGVAFGDFKISK